MAGTTAKGLFLPISADASGLTTAAKAARITLADLGTASGDLQRTMQENFAKLGGDGATQSARSIEAAYRRTFQNIRQTAQQTLSQPLTAAGVVSTNVSSAQAELERAQNTAVVYRELADAQARLVAGSDSVSASQRQVLLALEGEALAAKEAIAPLEAQVAALRMLQGETGEASAEIVGAHTRMGASGLIAEHVVRSLSDSIAAGQSPVRALTMETGRITEAMTLFSLEAGESEGAFGRFASFMGGKWGIAISIAVAVLAPLVEKLFDAGDAASKTGDEMAKAVTAADSFGNAQGELGKIIDLTTGKLKTQNQVLIEQIKLQAQSAILAAKSKEKTDTTTLQGTGQQTFMEKVQVGLAGIGSPYGGDYAAGERAMATSRSQQARLAPLQGVIDTFVNSKQPLNQAVDGAIAAIDKLAKAGQLGGRDPIKVKQGILALGADRNDQKAQQDVIDAIDGKGIAPELKPYERPKKPPKPKVDHTVEKDANKDRAYQAQVDSAQEAYARAQLGLSTTADQRYKVDVASLQDRLKQRLLEIDDMVTAGKIPGQTKEEVAANAEVLRSLARKTEQLDEEKASRDRLAALLDQQVSAARAQMDSQLTLLGAQRDGAVGRNAQYAIAQQQLTLQQQKRRDDLAVKLKPGSDATPQQKNDALITLQGLPAVDAQEKSNLTQQYQSPIQAYIQQMKGNMDDAFENVGVDALKGLQDGLVGVLSGTESVKKAFKSMADSIVADLLKIGIEKAVLSAVGGGSFFGLKLADGGKVGGYATGGLPGYASGGDPSVSGGRIKGAGTARSDSILAIVGGKKPIRVSNGEGIVNARAVDRYWPVIDAMNRGTFSGFADGGLPSIPAAPRDMSASEMRQVSGSKMPPIQIAISAEEGALFRPVVHSIAGQHAQVAEGNATEAGAQLAQDRAQWRQGRQLGTR